MDVYDGAGNIIDYYIKEIDAPEGYFESDTVLKVQLSVGEVTGVDVEGEDLYIYDEPELTVSVPVVWIDYDLDATTMPEYDLEGATVYLYKAVYADDGSIDHYEYVEAQTSVYNYIDGAYATFAGLKHDQDYVFVLGMSGVTDEDAENYPLYASTDYSDDYAGESAPAILSAVELESYQYISYNNTDITARTDKEDTSLKNYLLHLEIDILKYCVTQDHGTAKLITVTIDGVEKTAWYVNSAMFYLYRQKLTDEQLTALANGEEVELTYDATDLERVSADTTSNGGKAALEDIYDDTYVYWLIEATTGTGHSWATGTSYYRVLLYPEVLAENNGSFSATNATEVQSFDPTEISKFEVENTCGSGSHQYMISTIFMNKWAGDYDVYGEDTEDYFPLGGVTFEYYLGDISQSFVLDGAEAQTTKDGIAIPYGEEADEYGNTQADNDAGQVSTRFKFAEILNQWYVAVAQDAGLNVAYITDITGSESNLTALANYGGWSDWEGMLFVAASADAADISDLTDLAENDGEAAMRILYAFADAYPTCTITSVENGNSAYVSNMENILCEFGLDSDLKDTSYLYSYYGYYSYYAHIAIKETSNGNYAELTDTYDLYLQFRPTGGNGLANIKYFYLDEVDREDYYYDSDPGDVDTMALDAALDSTVRKQIVNMPTLSYSLTVTKYGYTMTSGTLGKTDDDLDSYFGSGSTSLVPLESTFSLQRYDSKADEWKYYSATAKTYVDSASDARFTTDSSDGQYETTLPLGYYRLIEDSVDDNYEVILDGTNVTAEDSTSVAAVRYFWITGDNNGENTVNIYDPTSADLSIEKYSLSGTSITSGVTFTLTNVEDSSDTYTGTYVNGVCKISNLPAGTYEVTETVANSNVTDDYFQSFTITIGYGRSAVKGIAEYGDNVTEYDTYVTGLTTDIEGQVACDVEGRKDSISGSVTSSGATATLTVHNPSTGSLTITKQDSSTGNTVTSGTMTFKLYYTPFTSNDLNSEDVYVVVSNDDDAPTFNASTWTLVDTYITTSGVKTVSGLTPGWYAIVETEEPSGYELNSEVQVVAVKADMTADHTKENNGNVAVTVTDTKKVGLDVTKTFNLEDFSTDLTDEANDYSVTYGLYVYDTTSQTYVSAYDLGLTTTSGNVTVYVTNNTSGSVTTGTESWANLIQMEAQLVDGVYTVTKDGVAYALDGCYYIKEEAVTNTGTNEDITESWWTSSATMTSESSSGMDVVLAEDEEEDDYYKVSGFTGNATGTVAFTNDLAYATVTILKTNTNSNYLSGAEFTVYSDENCTNEVEKGTTGEYGTCTITVLLSSTEATTFYIRETKAPDGYTLYEETITVTLTSGQKISYVDSDYKNLLTVIDNNGVYVRLTKYNNIHDYEEAETLSGVTFTLLRSTDDGATWTVQRTYTTDSDGGINFDTLKNSEDTWYMLAETGYNTTLYDGLESMWYTLADEAGEITMTETEIKEPETVTVNGFDYTGYPFTLEGIKAGSTYQLYAYNQPRPAVTFVKEGYGTDTTVPTATLEIYQVDAGAYSEGDTLTSDEVSDAKDAGTYVTTVTTKAVSGEEYSSVTYNLSAGTYLVVETLTSGGSYIINKEDSNEVWYQIIKVADDGTTEMTAASFVNVTEDYGLTIEKSGTEELDSDLLTNEDGQDLAYTLNVDVTASGPINSLTVEDTGLLVTKVYDGVGSNATEIEISETEAADYLEDEYTITSVKIPADATYTFDSLVFNTGDKDTFAPDITAKVTFTYANGTTEEQTAVLAKVSGDYWTVTPYNSNLKVVSFTVTWYDETLKTYTGYELGSSFKMSGSGSEIKVAMHIDQQNGGTEAYYAVAEIRNTASVTYQYSDWNENGIATDASETDTATQLTEVPNVTAPVLNITKSVVNDTTGSDTTAIIGNTLLYTITVTNSSDSLALDSPILLDLLPQGLVAVSAEDENSFYGNVTITGSTNDSSTLAIENVYHTNSDGYTLLEIVTSGSLAANEIVTMMLEATVDATVLNYLDSGSGLTNTVWVTSTTDGTVYHDNTAGSVFMGDSNSWAGNYAESTSTGQTLAELLTDLGLTGYGYISNNTEITYQATSAVNILKEVQGDQDDTSDWYHGDEGGTVTTNTSEEKDDDGYANFRLTVTNMNENQDLVNIVLMDIVPKEDGTSFNSNLTKDWSLNFNGITSVTIGNTEIDEGQYTLWYYTGDMTASSEPDTMLSTFDDKSGDWVRADSYTGEKSAITAFAVVFDSAVKLGYNEKLQLIYKADVPQMSEDEAASKAHLATYNDFRLIYQTQIKDVTQEDVYTLDSNYVYVLLEAKPVGVGGMAWIDANGDGMQDSEDVNPDTYNASTDSGTGADTATTYNNRTVNYADYSVVNSLLNSMTMQLLIYNGSTVSSVKTDSSLSGNSWRFLFEDLTTANISSAYNDSTAYNDDGINWKALAGSTNATWYQLMATVNGNGIKYSLTGATTDVESYDPENMYNDTIEGVLNDSNFKTSDGDSGRSTITTGSTSAYSEKFFLYSGDEWNLAEDIGLVIYRDLTITKKDTEGDTPKSKSVFAVYGPYAADDEIELSADKLVDSYTLGVEDDSETSHTFKNLLYFQRYVIVETSADDSYDLSAAKASGSNIEAIADGITLNGKKYSAAWILNIPGASSTTDPAADNTLTTDNVTVTNGLVTKNLTFEKVESNEKDEYANGQPVSGVTFTLKQTEGSGWSTWLTNLRTKYDANELDDIATGITYVSSVNNVFTFKTDFTGDVKAVTLLNLPFGIYTLTETGWPAGYNKDGLTITSWTVEVNADGAKIYTDYGTDNQKEVSAGESGLYEFTNVYTAEGKLTLSVKKTEKYHGASIADEYRNYTFELLEASCEEGIYVEGDAAADPITVNLIATDSDSFAAIDYTSEGTHYYIIKEEAGSATGITYDSTQYWIKVRVSDSNHNGKLTVTVEEVLEATPDGNGGYTVEVVDLGDDATTFMAEFTNEYKADGSQKLAVTKNVHYGSKSGALYRNIGEDLKFTFDLLQETDTGTSRIETVTISGSELNENGGTFTSSFDDLKYTAEDIGQTYTYIVKETTTTTGGFELDTTEYEITIAVKDSGNADGSLTCVVTVNGEELTSGDDIEVTFDNVYSAQGKTELSVSKQLDNRHSVIAANLFAAELQEGTVTDGIFTASASDALKASFSNAVAGSNANATFELKYTEPGDYWYRLTEWMPDGTTDNNDGTYTYDATTYYVYVKVTDNQNGTLKAEVVEIHKGSPTGTTETGTVTFENTTTTTYRVKKIWKGDDDVSGVTRPVSIRVQLMRTISDTSNSEYPYTDITDWEKVDTQTLNAGNGWSYDWSGSSLEKYDAKGNLYTYYAFEADADGNALTAFDGARGNTSYTVTTATESNAQTITNTLDIGALSITKTVEGLETSKEAYPITVVLKLDGQPLAGTYSYEISLPDGPEDNGVGTFGDTPGRYERITVTEAGTLTLNLYQDETLRISGLPLGTTYEVTEKLGDNQQYYIASYSDAVGEVTETNASGTVSAENADAAVTINNIYNPEGSLTLSVVKHENYHNSTNPEPRVYSFRLYELATASDAYMEVATGSDATEIWKWADSSNMLDEALIEITGDVATASNSFGVIDYRGYTAQGYYYYLVEEGIPSPTYRTFDTTKYVIEVLVTDGDNDHGEGEGVLGATVTRVWELTYDTDGVTLTALTLKEDEDLTTSFFTNRYDADGELTLWADKKIMYGDELYSLDNRGEDIEFIFDLYDSEGEILDTQTRTLADLATTGEARVPFKALTYDQEDIGKTYIYTVMERAVNAIGYLENTQKFTVEVYVSDDGKNHLTFDVSYDESDRRDETETGETGAEEANAVDSIVFVNTYFPKGDAKLIISKTLEGAELPADLFAASIRPIEIDETTGEIIYGDETTIETKTFDADGETFFTMDYDAEGDYWYEVREVIPWADIPATASNADDGTYTYDESVYYVKITVTDQHDGTLAATSVTVTETSPTGASVEVETVENGKTFRSITFENKYTGSKVDVPVTKVWKDYENRYKTRPESITVTLYRDGEKTDQTLELNDGNDWTDVFTDLDEYNYGDKIVYTVEESSIEGYAGVITGDTAEGYEITNTWTKEAPGIQIVKTASTKEDGTAYKRGEVITYTIVVTNTGNVVLTDVVVTDELTGNSGDNAWTVDSLEPGESVTFTATYTVVSADVTAKNVHNEASVTAKDPEGKDVEDDDSTDTPTRSSSGSGGGGSGSSGSGSSSSTSSTSSGGPGVGSGLAEDEMISLLPIDYGELAKTGEGRETEAWMFTSLLSGLMLILTAWLKRKKEEDE
ncbi:MAG: Cna B-type domain-containing protein [Clostridiales bacterium]|nr:Cna B-type domain-containing protein [Clostridiales bacterium]